MGPARRHVAADESGDIIGGWLVRLVVFMAVFATVGYEIITVGLNYVHTEDAAQEVARAGRRAYRETPGDERQAAEAAQAEADARDVRLGRFEVDGDHVVAEVTSTADALFVDGVGLLDDLTTRTATSRIRWRE